MDSENWYNILYTKENAFLNSNLDIMYSTMEVSNNQNYPKLNN